MGLIQQFLKSFRETDEMEPGLIQKADGTVWLVLPDGTETQLSGGTGYLTRRAVLFTESTGSGTYETSVVVPSGTSILDVAVFVLAGPWKAGQAVLNVGDEFHADGYIVNADLVNTLNKPYDNTTANGDHGVSWADPNAGGGAAVYGGSANWYSAGNSVYTPTVRYPDGATITATVTALAGGPILATNISPPGGSGGIGFAPGDTGTIHQGLNTSATYRVVTVDGGGAILTYTVTDAGDGYFIEDSVDMTATSGSGTFASLNITAINVQPISEPGIVVVDVIGFGVPTGLTLLPTKS